MSQSALKVIIVGCGLGGLATALSILHYSKSKGDDRKVKITLLERAELISEVGAGLTLMPNGLRILKRWIDLDEAGLGSRSTGGGKLFDLSTGEQDMNYGGSTTESEVERHGGWLHVHRGDLQTAILDRVKAIGGQDVEVYTGQAVTDVDPSIPSVTLADGRVLSADLVVGADGIKSACRAALFPDQNNLVSSAYAYRFQLPASLFSEDPMLAPMMHRHSMYGKGPFRIVVYPIRQGQIANLAILCPPHLFQDKDIGWSIPTSAEEVIRNLGQCPGGLCDAAKRILELMSKHADIRTWRIADRDVLQTYTKGSAILLGDAAHAMAPTYGQGVNQALEDAAILGKLLADTGKADIPTVLRKYSHLRVERGGCAQVVSRLAARGQKPDAGTKPTGAKEWQTVGDVNAWLWGTDVLAMP